MRCAPISRTQYNENLNLIFAYLSDSVDAEVQPLEAGHAKEGSRHDLPDEVAAEVKVLKRGQGLEVYLLDGL